MIREISVNVELAEEIVYDRSACRGYVKQVLAQGRTQTLTRCHVGPKNIK